MYKVKWDILPCSISEFVSKKDMGYEMRVRRDFERKRQKNVLNGSESLRILGPKIWDLIPENIKSEASLTSFKNAIKKWCINDCPCRLCKIFIPNLGFL